MITANHDDDDANGHETARITRDNGNCRDSGGNARNDANANNTIPTTEEGGDEHHIRQHIKKGP
jgi:hypothetical protein